jgi:hypothetical protein
MKGIAELARRIMKSRVMTALAAVPFVLMTALATGPQLLHDVTGTKDPDNMTDLWVMANRLTVKAVPITVAVAPLVFVGGALMMQFGGPSGAKRASTVMYGSVGAVVAVSAARGLVA